MTALFFYMKNKVQLITYANRFGEKGISEIHAFLKRKLAKVFEGGIHILPFYNSINGADAGYDPINHTETDKKIGTWEDIKKLAVDFDIMADMIVNHISVESNEFKDVDQYGINSKYFDLFITKEKIFGKKADPLKVGKIYRPRPGLPFSTIKLSNGEKHTFWTTFTSKQLDIDVIHKKGEEYLDNILKIFSKNGIKIIRLDAAGYAIKKPGTSCFMLPETYSFIKNISQKAHLLGMEVLVEIHSHYRLQLEIAKEVDYIYDFALPPLVLHSIYTKSSKKLKYWLKISPKNVVTVLDTHDGIGVIDVADHEGESGLLNDDEILSLVEKIHLNSNDTSTKATGTAASNLDLYQVNCTFYEALGKNDFNYLMARAIQFFCPGVPQVYYVGLLAGVNDLKLLEKTKVGRDINRHFYSFEEIEASLEKEIVKALITLIKFRNTHASFQGELEVIKAKDSQLVMRWNLGTHWSELHIDFNSEVLKIRYSKDNEIKMLDFSYLKKPQTQT